MQAQFGYFIIKLFYMFVGLLVCYAEIRQAIKLRKTGYAWVKWCLGFMGIYWFGYNLCLVLKLDIVYPELWNDVPGLLTLSLIAAGALLSLRRNR